MKFPDDGIGIVPISMSVLDCGPKKQSKKDFAFTVKLKISALKQMLEAGFMPVNSYKDGRIILKAPKGSRDKFAQLHVRQEGDNWAIVSYPCDTAEGREMLTLEEQEAEFPDSTLKEVKAFENDKGEIELQFPSDDECDCPACTLRKAFEKTMPEELAGGDPEDEEKRTLH